MKPNWGALSESDRTAYRVISAFLNGRLEERETINWALRIHPNEDYKRLAVLDLLDSLDGVKISDPWKTAWRLIEENWEHPKIERHESSNRSFYASSRLNHGDRSTSLVSALVNLVAPRLHVDPFNRLDLKYTKLPRRPKKIEDLFKIGLESGPLVDPDEIKLSKIQDLHFLISLAHALEAAIVAGLNAIRQIGKDFETWPWVLGQLNRVYFVSKSDRPTDQHEPDEFHTGIAPSAKLLYAVVDQIKRIDVSKALEFARRWREMPSGIHVRLWAALARDKRIESASEVSRKLLNINDRQFWTAELYPEVAELRACRYGQLGLADRKHISSRLREGPPRSIWRKKMDAEIFQKVRLNATVTEFRRIQLSGGKLLKSDEVLLKKSVDEIPDLARIEKADAGFLTTPKMRSVHPIPDIRYDALTGKARLKELDAALSVERDSWSEVPTKGAADWIISPGNALLILSDLEQANDAGGAYFRVWERFGWTHAPAKTKEKESPSEDRERKRVLKLLRQLPETTIRPAIDGISHWLSTWLENSKQTAASYAVWMRIWPLAVEATNKLPEVDDELDLETIVRRVQVQAADENFDTLNPPVGKLVGVFLSACPNLSEVSDPFAKNGRLRKMRGAVISAQGKSGSIARHRLIESLSYFLRADPEWTKANLVSPLVHGGDESLKLWRAVARRTRFTDVLEILGEQIVEHATDTRLSKQTRGVLVLSLVVECLHALREHREPAIAFNRVQQMIRSLDDESRAEAADVVRRYLVDLSGPVPRKNKSFAPEQLFRSSVVPFLRNVWPQERSLSRAGVSKAFADLPFAAGESFADAVSLIERFLVPFDCWSMMDFGFRVGDGENAPLQLINNQKKASALLQLLDLSIGTVEGAIVPHDLAEVLDHIRKEAPRLAEKAAFRRLAAAARRV